jgi:hypothetical protein
MLLPSCSIRAQALGNRVVEFSLDVQDEGRNEITQYYYSFGDGTSDNNGSETGERHTYPHAGLYAAGANLQVKNEQGLHPIKGINCGGITVTVQ